MDQEYLIKEIRLVNQGYDSDLMEESSNIDQEYNSDPMEETSDIDQRYNSDPMEETSNIEFAEDNYESILSNLASLIACIDQDTIHEVWHISTIEQNKEHFVVIWGECWEKGPN